jgi:hypothetical protein
MKAILRPSAWMAFLICAIGLLATACSDFEIASESYAFKGNGYVLTFDSDFNPGLNRIDDLGISIVLAIDTSGSMADSPARGRDVPKYVQTREVLLQLLDYLAELRNSPSMQGMKFRLGVLRFSSDIQIIQALTDVDSEGIASLQAILSDPNIFRPNGSTAIGAAIEKSTEMLAQSGTILKSVLVLSDGENTAGPAPAEVLFAINNNRNNFSYVSNPVLTRGTLVSVIGFDVEAGLFKPLAAEGAKITAAANQEDLQAALLKMLTADITLLEAASP